MLYYSKVVTEIYCVLTTCQISCTSIFLFLFFSSSAPCTPPKGLHGLLSHLRRCVKGESVESGRNRSSINPVKLEMFVGKAAFVHIRERTPNTLARVAAGIAWCLLYPTGVSLSCGTVSRWLNIYLYYLLVSNFISCLFSALHEVCLLCGSHLHGFALHFISFHRA